MHSECFPYRLKSLFLPVVLLSCGLLACYSLVNWLFLAGPGLEPLDDDVIDTWIPLTLAAFLEFALIAPRLQVLALKRHTLRFLFNCLAFVVLAAPVCLAQGEIRAASGQITYIGDASDIPAAPATRFYSAKTICIDRRQAGFKALAQPDESQTHLIVDVFAVVPVCASGKSAGPAQAWIGLTFHGVAKNSADPEIRKLALKDLGQEIDRKIAAEDPFRYRYLERSGHSAERRNFNLALKSRGLAAPEQQVVLLPRMQPFGQRLGNWLEGIGFALGFGALGWLTLVLLAPLDRQKLEVVRNGGMPHPNPAMTILIPTASSYGLQALICLNLIVFLAMMVSGLGILQFRTEDLVSWGANYGPDLQGLGVLRLITSQFVHSGIMHLVNNMYGLIIVGLFLAPAIGNWQMIACYLVCGLGSSITGNYMHPNIVAVGASGAILGLMGIALTLALLRDSRIAAMKPALVTNLAIFSAFTLVMGSLSTGIDNAAHMGGFLTGVVVGAVLYLLDRHLLDRRASAPGPEFVG
ncbi:MAG TPA: rhomboid family intramembrane serine protease [Rhizomicrobium sp.]|nr:rhomboid family intramembrane serine protease [Rhizomicrobium sp.]